MATSRLFTPLTELNIHEKLNEITHELGLAIPYPYEFSKSAQREIDDTRTHAENFMSAWDGPIGDLRFNSKVKAIEFMVEVESDEGRLIATWLTD